jgi:hypothetical protein
MQVVAEKVTFLGSAKREEKKERRPAPGRPDGNSRDSSNEGPPF